MKMTGHKPTVMFQRYNIIDIKDMRAAKARKQSMAQERHSNRIPFSEAPRSFVSQGS